MQNHHYFFFFFTAFFIAFVNAQQTINGIALPREVFEVEEYVKRDLDSNGVPTPSSDAPTFQWPRVDGPPENFPPIKDLDTAYWTFNLTFIKHMVKVNKTDPLQATELAFQAAVEYEYKWLHECWKMSNHSAAIHHRTNTKARVVVFPYMDKKTNIDPEYQLAPSFKMACWERRKGGNINKPVVNHTKKLIRKLGWDRRTALRKIRKMHKHLKPVNPPASKTKKDKKGKRSSK